MPIIFIVAGLLIALPPLFIKESNQVGAEILTYRIPYDSWNVTYTDKREELWQNKKQRSMSEHAALVDKLHGKHYWISNEISSEALLKAKELGASTLFLGYIYGTHEVYLNGEKLREAGKEEWRRPALIPLSKAHLENPEGLKIEIRIHHNLEEPWPDTVEYAGIASLTQIELRRRWDDFQWILKPALIAGANLSLGLFFLVLWLCGIRRQELAAFAIFGLVLAASQSLHIPLVWDLGGILNWHRLSFVLSVYGIFSVLLLGIAIARIRSRAYLTFLSIGILLPWLIFTTEYTAYQIFSVASPLWKYVTPITYSIAAFLCLGQARIVAKRPASELFDARRSLKLYMSAALFFSMSALALIGGLHDFDPRLNALLLGCMATLFLHDFRKQEEFASKSSVSKHHLRAELRSEIPCIAISVDLKQSEAIYRSEQLTKGNKNSLISDVIADFYDLVLTKGGDVVQTEGDAILFFFERTNTSAAEALAVLRSMNLKLEQFSKKISENNQVIKFRAAIEVGAIRPAWKKINGCDIPIWEQAGGGSIFVDLSRLLEAEKKLVKEPKSSLVFRAEHTKEIGLDSPLIQHRVELKHGQIWNVCIADLK